VTSVRARSCPWALAATWAWQAAAGLVVAWPAATLVKRAFGGDPRGDAALWDAGGHALLVLLSRESHAISAELTLASVVASLIAIAGLLPMAALMVAMLDRTGRRGGAAVGYAAARAMRALPALGALLLVTALIQAAAVGVAWLLLKVVDLCARETLDESRADWIEALVVAPFAPLLGAFAIVHDLARAAAIRFRLGAVGAATLAVAAFRRAPWSTIWGWTWRGGASLSLVLASALAAGALGGRPGFALVTLTIGHQATIAARVALRASWLAKALRTVAR